MRSTFVYRRDGVHLDAKEIAKQLLRKNAEGAVDSFKASIYALGQQMQGGSYWDAWSQRLGELKEERRQLAVAWEQAQVNLMVIASREAYKRYQQERASQARKKLDSQGNVVNYNSETQYVDNDVRVTVVDDYHKDSDKYVTNITVYHRDPAIREHLRVLIDEHGNVLMEEWHQDRSKKQ